MKFDADTISKLAEGMADGSRLHDGAAIAGSGLALPLVRLRLRTAQRELARVHQREGRRSDAFQAQSALVAGLAANEQALSRQFAQSVAPRARPGAGESVISGRVTRDGQPLFDAEVLVLDAQLVQRRRTCTGRDGRYSLALAADQDLLFELHEGGKPVYRDKTAQAYPVGYRGQRDFEIGQAEPVCDPAPVPGTAAQRLYAPDLGGLTREQAQKSLSALGLKPGKLSTQASAHVGLVIAQEPKPGAPVLPDSAVDLVLGAEEGKPAFQLGELKGQTLSQALKIMDEHGLALQEVTLSRGGRDGRPRVQAARLAGAGNGAQLEVQVAQDKAGEAAVIAAVLAASPEGRALGLDTDEQAAHWLDAAGISSLKVLDEAAAEDDVRLRKRLSPGGRVDVAGARKALNLAAGRITRS